jgi:hypothetical protein
MDSFGAADIVAATALGELQIRSGPGGPTAELADYYCIEGRGFGGYTAALAVLAASADAGAMCLRSVRVLFTGAAVPGELLLDVQPLGRGRTAAAYQVTIRQADAVVVSASAWFTAPELLASATSRRSTTEVPPPKDCPRVTWVEKSVPFLSGFEERAIDFPVTDEQFRDGRDSLALWAAPAWPLPVGDTMAERLSDIMLLDAHLMDPAQRAAPRGTSMTSLDLDVTWHTPIDVTRTPSALTLIEAHARTDGLIADTRATLADVAGLIRATGTSQCRVYPPTGRRV